MQPAVRKHMTAQYAPWAGDRIWVRGDYTESAPAILAEDVDFEEHSNDEEEVEESENEDESEVESIGESEGQVLRSRRKSILSSEYSSHVLVPLHQGLLRDSRNSPRSTRGMIKLQATLFALPTVDHDPNLCSRPTKSGFYAT